MPTERDRYRLEKGQKAMNLEHPQTITDAKIQLMDLADAICALQSMDDLGSPEANDAAWNDMLVLQERYNELKYKIDHGELNDC
jgi:hypothetical protein